MTTTPPSDELKALRRLAKELLEDAVHEFRVVADRFEVPYQSTCVIVHPIDWSRGHTLLRVIAPILRNVASTDAVHRRLSELNNTSIFGKFYLLDGTVFLEHNLLGESVDRRQFRAVLAAVAHQADHLVEVLQAEFGGDRWRGSD